MKLQQFFVFSILFMAASGKNTATINENVEITEVLSNATNENSGDSIRKNLEVREKPDKSNPERTSQEETNHMPDKEDSIEGWNFHNKTLVEARRILNGKKVERGSRPYMVYLQCAKSTKRKGTNNFLCGGVIVHKEYVITSAACVEEMERFYVIAGTGRKSKNRKDENECVRNNKRKVIWKCVPKNYQYDSISENWSINDIAVVKVDKPFKLGKVEDGCQYAAKTVAYNKVSREMEEPETSGLVLGWGYVGKFRESLYRKYNDADEDSYDDDYQCLQEARVTLMDKDKCAAQYPSEMREMIKEFMICTEDIEQMSKRCREKYANCTAVLTRRELQDDLTINSNQTEGILTESRDAEHLRNSYYVARRNQDTGGFCDNDHGGPLIVTRDDKDYVVGVISASKVDRDKGLCYGPFLYTSVFTNRQFLSCAIHKTVDEDCRRVFRSGFTHEEWTVDWNDDD